MTLNYYRDTCHEASKEAGWWNVADASGAILGTKIALIHSEVSEMLEGLRKGLPDSHLPHRSAEEAEAADALIRLFDYAGARNLDLEGAFLEKMSYNKERLDHKKEARDANGGKKF